MKITCPHCGVAGSARDSVTGGKVRCPQCEKVFQVVEQKIVCPHCSLVGLAIGSSVSAKFRCPRCAKVFLLNQAGLAESYVKDATMVGSGAKPVAEASDVALSTGGKESGGVSESVPEVEPTPESVAELVPVDEPESAVDHGTEPDVVLPVTGEESALAAASEEEERIETPEEVPMPVQVCAGCGKPFSADLLEKVGDKVYCAVCHIRSATLDGALLPEKVSENTKQDVVIAFIVLGLLAIVVLILMKIGIL